MPEFLVFTGLHVLRCVDDMDSNGVRNLAEKIGSGKLSVAAAADCASAFQCDESVKVVAFCGVQS